jgi:hypothetical protein
MIGVLILLVLAILVGLFLYLSSEPPPPEVDPEEALKSAIELHKIRSKLDVALTKSEQRRDGQRIRRRIRKAFDDGAGHK